MTRQPKSGKCVTLLYGLSCVLILGAATIGCCGQAFATQPPEAPSPEDRNIEALLSQISRFRLAVMATMAVVDIDKTDGKEPRKASLKACELIREMGPKAVPSLVRILDSSHDVEMRISAVVALGEIGPPAFDAVPRLIETLRDRDDDARIRGLTLQSLKQIEEAWWTSDCIPLLVRDLGNKDPYVSNQAARILGNAGLAALEAVPALIDVLQDDRAQTIVRKSAATALIWIDPDSPVVEQALLYELDDKDIGRHVIGLYANRSGTWSLSAAPILIGIGLADEPPLYALYVVKPLANIGPKAPGVTKLLIDGLTSDDRAFRESCIEALGKFGEESDVVVPALSKMLSVQYDNESRLVASALGCIGPKARGAVPHLVNVIKNNPAASGAAVTALGHIGVASDGVVPVLVELLKSRHWQDRRKAAIALGRLKPVAKQAIPALRTVLKDNDIRVRCRAALALARMGPITEDVARGLAAALESDELHFPVEVLGELGSKAEPVVPSLIRTLKARSGWNRICAAKALGRIGPVTDDVVPALVRALNDENFWVCIASAEALCRIGQKTDDAIDALSKMMLKTGPTEARILAAKALGRIGPITSAVVPALSKALAEDNIFVKIAAAETLEQIGPAAQDGLPTLVGLLKHKNAGVRKAAARALQAIRKSSQTGQAVPDTKP